MDDNSKIFEPLAAAVAAGSSIRSAAADLNCGESTAYHVSSTPEFRQRVAEIRSAVTSEVVGRLISAATKAVETLEALLADEQVRPSERIAAAKALLSNLKPVSELGELRQRIAELEERQHIAELKKRAQESIEQRRATFTTTAYG